ncbi:MAG: Na+/H+ antiporter NhaA [Planctomycetales bacterium]|nr:Na+/H+ antiporter NhaA [Planctomycetales bacterium]
MSDTISPSEPDMACGMPETRIGRWTQPFVRFFQIQSTSGFLLIACTAIALLLANSPWSASFAEFWQIRLRISVGQFELDKPLLLWLNDGLMTVFFFVVGLEIKREFMLGELRDPRNAALPIVAAIGGMIVPAGIYFLLQSGQPGQSGWGIPVATDIAFVAGFLALLGSRLPTGLKIMLMSLAIADDIGAILIIAFFYSTDISFVALGFAAVGFGVTYILNRIGVRQVSIYFLVGAGVWLAFLKSGVHPTVAGVLLGFLTPSKAWVGSRGFPIVLTKVLERLVKSSNESTQKQRHRALSRLATTAREGTSPLERLEFGLHPWVAFLIMPLFALANSGVSIEVARLGSPVAIAVAAGLVLGKPIGIVLFSWIATKLGFARLPAKVSWKIMFGAACMAGIGFTMSIFIAGLALQGALLDDGKIGTLVGSTISAVFGCSLLLMFIPKISEAAVGLQKQQADGKERPESQASDENMQVQCEDRWRDDGGQGGFNKE